MTLRVRIESVPAGEAPLWVREQWVGLVLPLAQRTASPISVLTSGVVSGPKTLLATLRALFSGKLQRERGFAVETRAAMAALASRSPEAAAWWRENVPHVLRPRRYFIFQHEAGTVVDAEGGA